jgi:sulfur-oxidizing protein SoxY
MGMLTAAAAEHAPAGAAPSQGPTRRLLLEGAAAAAGCVVLGAAPMRLSAQPQPAAAPWPQPTREALLAFTGGVWPEFEAGPGTAALELDVAPLVDNGNAVPVVLAWRGAPRCEALALLAERNPLPEMLQCRFGPAAASQRLAARVRLATSQRLLLVARFAAGARAPLARSVEVVVTLASCVEGET